MPKSTTATDSLAGVTDWPKQRKSIQDALRKLLGKLPKQRVDLQLKTIDEQDFPGYMRRRVNYFVDDWERITAWVFIPEDSEDAPALLCCHAAVPQGKDEPAGLNGDPNLALAKHYAELGFVTIAPDTITAGERIVPGKPAYDTSVFYKEHSKASALGRMYTDHQHAIDALAEIHQVDDERIGVIGHDLGAVNALILSALDDRIRTCVSSCGITRFAEDPGVSRWLDADGFTALPQLQKAIDDGEFPLDWEHIIALAAPTPMLLITALNDDQLANTTSCGVAVDSARPIYKGLAAGRAIDNVTHKKGHTFPYEALANADEWFDSWL
jgi:cephalosporin-C deacetylase-like acetyl esterase